MSKINLDQITSGYNLSKINANFQRIGDELNNKVLYRDSPIGEPNGMSSNLDMNGRSILNVNKISSNALELGGVQVTPESLVVDPYNGTMEALRSIYAEYGYNVVGTFQAGFTYVNANDVGIDKDTGKGYTGAAGYVSPGTDPTSGGFVDRSYSYKGFFCVADMVSDAEMKAGSVARTLGYYEKFDGGGATYLISPNTTSVIAGDLVLASGLVAKIQVDGVADSRQFGAKPGVDTFDCAAAISGAIKRVDVKQLFIYGHQYLLTPLDLTEVSSDVSGRKKISGYSGGTGVFGNGTVVDDDYSDCLVLKHNQACGIDLSGSSLFIFENLGVMSDYAISPRAGLLLQRTAKWGSCKRHIFRNCRIHMRVSSALVNSGVGYVGVYNSRGEDNTFEDCIVIADAPHVLTIDDALGIESPFKGGYVNPDYSNYTVSNNRFENSGAVSNISSPYTLDGVSALYIDGGYHNGRNKNRLVRCINRHSRNIRVRNASCEEIGAFLKYDAVNSIGYDPSTFSFVGGQLSGFDSSASDRWDGMFEFSGSNLNVSDLEFDCAVRSSSKLISFIKFTGAASLLTGVRVYINSASSTNDVFDGKFINGDVTADNIEIMCGGRTAESVYSQAHTDLRKFRNYRIRGKTSCAFSKFATVGSALDVTFTDASGTPITPASFSLYMSSVNGVNTIKGYVRLASTTPSGSLRILLANTFFPIRTSVIGIATFSDSAGFYANQVDASFTTSTSVLTLPMSSFNSSTKKEAEIHCIF